VLSSGAGIIRDRKMGEIIDLDPAMERVPLASEEEKDGGYGVFAISANKIVWGQREWLPAKGGLECYRCCLRVLRGTKKK